MLEAIGYGGQLRLGEDNLVISRKGLMGFLSQGMKGDKEISLEHISSVQFKAAGTLMNGYIQFAFVGGTENQAGIFGATADENSVMFTASQQPEFEIMRDAIKARIAAIRAGRGGAAAATSAADEIAKLAKLRDEDVLTEEEFLAKKRQLLGL